MERSRGPQAVSTGSPSLVPVLADLIGTDGVVEELVLRGPVGVMALHGGLEAGTAPAGRQCARLAGASFYAVVQPGDFRWHVPSTRFDPLESRKLTTFLEHVKMAVSIHGFGGQASRARFSLEDATPVFAVRSGGLSPATPMFASLPTRTGFRPGWEGCIRVIRSTCRSSAECRSSCRLRHGTKVSSTPLSLLLPRCLPRSCPVSVVHPDLIGLDDRSSVPTRC